jgi:ACS family hexuronate transporter-like MFS transporter
MKNLNPFKWGKRWQICSLLFFATTINYMDRQIFGILGPTLQNDIGWSESQYGLIVAAFTMAYAVSNLVAGRFLDWIGVKKGFAISLAGWSLAAIGHAFASTPLGFGIARVFLGATEAGNFPAALKATAEWFPKKERSLATGIFNSGSNVGVVLAAILVPLLTLHFGWRTAFIAQGCISLLWLFFWIPVYRKPAEHKNISPAELAYIQSDKEELAAKPLPLKTLLGYRQTWAFAVGKIMTDPVWWFYLYWLPKYLFNNHGITLGSLALPLVIIYIMADVGSVVGGWLSAWFEGRGQTHKQSRRSAMLVCAVTILPTLLLPFVTDVWSAVFLVSLAAAGHQGWSANLLNLPSDNLPASSVATVAGIGQFFGSASAMLFQAGTGYLLEWNGKNYAPVFVVCGLAYSCAWLVLRWLSRTDQKNYAAGESSAG